MSVRGLVIASLAVACSLLVPTAERQLAPGGAPADAARAPAHASIARLQRIPIAAQALISSTIADGSRVFDARRTPTGYRLAGGGVTATLGRRSVRLGTAGGSLSLTLTLQGIGRGRTLAPVGQAPPVAHANRAVVGLDGVSEWYAAGPLGLEQGFSVTRRPSGAGQLTLALRHGGSLVARRVGATIVFLAHGRVVLRYGGLGAVDATGRSLRTSLALRGNRLLLHVLDRGAAYPVSIDPFIQQPPTLTAGSGAFFGYSVALSANADTALIGGFKDGGGSGGAWVFGRSGTTWALLGGRELVGDCPGSCDGNGSGETGPGQFGTSVALSGDGSTALIGAPADNGGIGAAWVFTRSGSSFSQTGSKLVGPSASAFFGSSVALSTNGTTAVIGAPGTGGNAGSASAFTGSPGSWTQHPLTPVAGCQVGPAPPQFGFSVALSSGGTTALVGAPADNASDGAAWVFTGASTGPWSQQAKLVGDNADNCPAGGGDGTGEQGHGTLGSSVALSPDGATALVGAPADNAAGTGSAGAAWLFTRAGSTWSQQGTKLIGDCTGTCPGPNGTGETNQGKFGTSVAVSNNGATALIGASSAGGTNDGGVWAFTGSPSTGWSQEGSELVGDCSTNCNGNGMGETPGGNFGQGVALSSDGSLGLIGAPSNSSGTGGAWTFAQPPACSNTSATTPAGGGSVTLPLSCTAPLDAPLTYAVVSGPGRGILSSINQANGTVTYTSQAQYQGPDAITYQATDSGGTSTIATVTITVPPAPPTCANVSSTAPPGGGSVRVTLSCRAPSGVPLTYAIVSQPSHGGLGALDQSTGIIIYTSQKLFSGSDAFTYLASDSGGGSSPVTATITIPHAPPPAVSIVGDSTPVVGQASTYSASVIDTSATPNHYQWTIDGHKAGSTSSIRHTFTTGGRHSVLVRVGDTAGSSAQATLKVNPGFRRLVIATPWTERSNSRVTEFTSLAALAVPDSTTIQLSCTGGGCPFFRHRLSVNTAPVCRTKKCRAAHKHPPKTRDVDLSGLVRGRRLAVGARLQISFTLQYFEGQSTVFTINSTGPHRATQCLTPGTTKVLRHC